MSDDHDPVGRTEAAAVLAVVLAVVGVLVLVVFVLIGGNDETQVPRTAPPSGTANGPGGAPSGTASGAPGETGTGGGSTPTLVASGSSGRCLPPSADVLAGNDLAFDATVVSIDRSSAGGDTVTLEPTRFFTGDESDRVEVRAPGRQLTALLDATTFRDGDRYLVAATGDRVAVCGLSAAWSPSLERLYEQAFG